MPARSLNSQHGAGAQEGGQGPRALPGSPRGSDAGQISIAEAKDALLRSGYLLEHRLEQVLRRRGWYVQANSAYLDKQTGKSRELDIYALRMERLSERKAGFIWAVLLIECVNNLQPLTLITKKPAFAPLHSEEIKLAGLPAKAFIRRTKNWLSIPAFLDMYEYHHYCRGRIATQFCSFSRKKETKQWMASHDDLHFDSLRTLCEATEYARDKFFDCFKFARPDEEFLNVEFYYPVLVLQGGLFEARSVVKKSLDLRPALALQYRRSAVWMGQERDYQIDVVTEASFPKYLSMIGEELTRTATRMRRKRGVMQDSLARIVRRVQRLRSTEKIRAEMEYVWSGLALSKSGQL